MKEKFIENGIEYVRHEDYYLPNIAVPDDKTYNIGKYGRLHSKFIKENHRAIYSMRMLIGTWLAYLEEIATTAREIVNKLIKDMAVKQGIKEELKSKDPFAWVSAMEQIKHIAEEIVFSDLIYSYKTN